ncbi:MAG: hypothetical protein V4443_07535 [Pseudomonadota bacterium]
MALPPLPPTPPCPPAAAAPPVLPELPDVLLFCTVPVNVVFAEMRELVLFFVMLRVLLLLFWLELLVLLSLFWSELLVLLSLFWLELSFCSAVDLPFACGLLLPDWPIVLVAV